MIPVQKAAKQPDLKTISLHDWLKGRRSDTDYTRTDNGALAVTDNVIVEQDGVVAPRPATVPYGMQFVGECIGIDDFTKIVGGKPESWLVTMQVVDGVGKIFVNKDGGVWQECAGKTYDPNFEASFVQGAGKILIMNGKDYLSYLDTTTLTITLFSALARPAAPTVTPTGMTGSAITYRFRVTATSTIGETDASVAATVATSLARSQWTQTGSTPHFVTLSWTAIPNARGYCIYVGTEAGKEVFIGTVPPSSTSFVDDGSAVEIVSKPAPLGNSTQGPIVSRGVNVAGQIFLIGDGYKVWYGGSGDNAFDFSAYNGGGWIAPADGGKYVPITGIPFRDGKGTPMCTVFSSGGSGNGKITHLSAQSMNFGDTVISYMQADEANGQDGTNSPNAVAQTRDSAWYPSGNTFKTTGTKPQVQNILSTDNISDAIYDDMQKLNYKAMAKASAAVVNGRIHWALPVGSDENNQIWTLDLTRGGQWMLPWNFKAKKLLVYGSNDGVIHFLANTGKNLVEFTRNLATQDTGVAFPTRVGSGFIKAEKTGTNWMYLVDVTVVLINPQGQIDLSVKAKTKDGSIAELGKKNFLPQVSYSGWGEIMNEANSKWGDVAWGEIMSVPVTYGSTRVTRTIPIKKAVNYFQWEISSSVKDTFYQVSDVVARYVDIGMLITEEMRR
jgi:hypothetical protein